MSRIYLVLGVCALIIAGVGVWKHADADQVGVAKPLLVYDANELFLGTLVGAGDAAGHWLSTYISGVGVVNWDTGQFGLHVVQAPQDVMLFWDTQDCQGSPHLSLDAGSLAVSSSIFLWNGNTYRATGTPAASMNVRSAEWGEGCINVDYPISNVTNIESVTLPFDIAQVALPIHIEEQQ
jgi:hypothetical protein